MDKRRFDSPLAGFLIGLMPIGLTILAVLAASPGGMSIIAGLLAPTVFIIVVVKYLNRRDDPRHKKRL